MSKRETVTVGAASSGGVITKIEVDGKPAQNVMSICFGPYGVAAKVDFIAKTECSAEGVVLTCANCGAGLEVSPATGPEGEA